MPTSIPGARRSILTCAALALGPVALPAQGARVSLADPAAYGAEVERAVTLVRRATAAYQNIDAAIADGFPRVVASCLANQEAGGMGHHHTNRARMDASVEIEKPEILLYSYHPDGRYVLNGVEYIVPFSVWPRDSAPPRVMGRDLIPSEGLNLWYLHVWIWTPNASGLFSDWNPTVTCRPAGGGGLDLSSQR
ncbi:MAG: hypothetical protein IT361_13705 [Gemmatimonadaceae bacterium]|nr:hypothetical protein [Gemmatimonadaceae bacterium]